MPGCLELELIMLHPQDPRDIQALSATCSAARHAATQGPLVLITESTHRLLLQHELDSLLVFLRHNGRAVRELRLDQMPAHLWSIPKEEYDSARHMAITRRAHKARAVIGKELPQPDERTLGRIVKACPQLEVLTLCNWNDVNGSIKYGRMRFVLEESDSEESEGESEEDEDERHETDWGQKIARTLGRLKMLRRVQIEHDSGTVDALGFNENPQSMLAGCPHLTHLGLNLGRKPARTLLSMGAARFVQLHLRGLRHRELELLAPATGLQRLWLEECHTATVDLPSLLPTSLLALGIEFEGHYWQPDLKEIGRLASSSQALEGFARLSKLQVLHLSVLLPEDGPATSIARFMGSFSELRSLDFGNADRFDDDAFLALMHTSTHLQHLVIDYTPVTRNAFSALMPQEGVKPLLQELRFLSYQNDEYHMWWKDLEYGTTPSELDLFEAQELDEAGESEFVRDFCSYLRVVCSRGLRANADDFDEAEYSAKDNV